MFSSRRCSLRVPGMGTIQGFWERSQARAIWPGVAPWRLGDARQHVDDRLVVLERVGVESGNGGADVVAGFEAGGGGDGAGEEALAERAVGHEADAQLLTGGEHPLLGAPPPQGVLALHGGDGLHGVGSTDRSGGRLGHAEVPDLARLDEVLDGAGDVLDGDVGVDPVLVEEVDRVDRGAQ